MPNTSLLLPRLNLCFVSVMRLTRPTLASPVITQTESTDLPGLILNNQLKNDITSVSGAESFAAGQFLLLPQSFGYLNFVYCTIYRNTF